jgi:hypothetical protein
MSFTVREREKQHYRGKERKRKKEAHKQLYRGESPSIKKKNLSLLYAERKLTPILDKESQEKKTTKAKKNKTTEKYW